MFFYTLFFLLAWEPGFANAAIDLDGEQAVEPATALDDPSPIADINTYYPDQHDCPLPCADYANVHSWIPYFSIHRLGRCQQPLLLQTSISQPLQDPRSNVVIRACALDVATSSALTAADPDDSLSSTSTSTSTSTRPMENPKKDPGLFQASLKVAPACFVDGTEAQDKLAVARGGGQGGQPEHASRLLEGMATYFATRDNCDENILFAYYNQTVAGLYIGSGLGKPTVPSAIQGLLKVLGRSGVPVANRTVVQLCGDQGRRPERVFGIVMDNSRDLGFVQSTVASWSQGRCVSDPSFEPAGVLEGTKVFDIAGAVLPLNGTTTTSASRRVKRHTPVGKRATCDYKKVELGDSCWALSVRCGISTSDFALYNPSPNLCPNLMPGDYICCSAGDPYTEPKPDAPKKGSDGVCATHMIQQKDTCSSLAEANGITVDDIEKWNQGKTWAWTECKDMLLGYNMCLSDGLAPMPPPQQGTECGPLVPGTKRPDGGDINIADLNPCPLKACCSNWGFCGVFPAHCSIHAPEGGGPGSKEKGFENTCVSNCGNEIEKNSGPPAALQRVGYYSAFSMNRKCLWLKAKNANTDSSYTHIHWAFSDIDPATWRPVIKDGKGEWADFKALTGVKRIISLGGWAFSTEAATYNIIRQAILENRDTFVNGLVQFVQDEGLDGIDIDWEYPGVSPSLPFTFLPGR